MINNWQRFVASGQVTIKTNIPGVTAYSTIMVNVCELQTIQGLTGPYDGYFPFLGRAIMTVHNIVTYDNGDVWVVIDTGWTDNDVNILLNYYGQE
jgi:hypothetical protein